MYLRFFLLLVDKDISVCSGFVSSETGFGRSSNSVAALRSPLLEADRTPPGPPSFFMLPRGAAFATTPEDADVAVGSTVSLGTLPVLA